MHPGRKEMLGLTTVLMAYQVLCNFWVEGNNGLKVDLHICDLGKLLIQEREFCATQGRASWGPLVQGEGLDCDAQGLGHGSGSFGQNVALELGLPFKQSLSCDFPKLAAFYNIQVDFRLGRKCWALHFPALQGWCYFTSTFLFVSWVYVSSDLQKNLEVLL